MKTHYLAWIFFCLVGFIYQPTTAAPASGNMHLNGIASYSSLGKDLYQAAIYTSAPTQNAKDLLKQKGPMRMEVRVTADKLFRRKFRQMWLENIAANSDITLLDQHTQNTMTFADILNITLVKGDVLAIATDHYSGISVTLNGTPLASIKDRAFFTVLLNSWIGPVPPSAEFRNDLLQGGKMTPGALASFLDIRPSTTRADSIGESLLAVDTAAAVAAQAKSPQPTSAQRTPRPNTSSSVRETAQVAGTAASQLASNGAKAGSATITTPTLSAAAAATKGLSTVSSVADTATPSNEKSGERVISEVPAVLSAQPASRITDQVQPPLTSREQIASSTETVIALQQQYIDKLRGWASQFLEYPYAAMDNNLYGELIVEVVVNRDGELVRSAVARTSGHKVLDQAALESLETAAPFPEIPIEIVFDEFTFNLPVVFSGYPQQSHGLSSQSQNPSLSQNQRLSQN